MQSIIYRTLILTAISICFAAPLVWGGENENCRNYDNQTQELVPAESVPAKHLKPRARKMNISDFVTGEQEPGSKGMAPVPQNTEPSGEKKIKKLLEVKGCDDSNCGD